MRTEEDVNKMIYDMVKRTKGKYITQACAFNKDCPRQMEMLKQALMSSVSFSGLVKEMLAMKFGGNFVNSSPSLPITIKQETKKKNVGNFL
ncbi:hypothetical protein PQE75_gp091 [Bacillus phage vB_BcoS-136]|uniref:Uncharacterized protein n=1 Tax=Bacillus phage vB_BcoS-136 TaxID=2419619 RepID=A0A3G3BVF0_9CAUD|nr:hypothetical protein PQE75_gp091 [Bacillus phage vB_BcoS-136]AYP68223.1 hypothetical protein vBBcoS136_00091 [Bacillus phage vB_BcoS-136]